MSRAIDRLRKHTERSTGQSPEDMAVSSLVAQASFGSIEAIRTLCHVRLTEELCLLVRSVRKALRKPGRARTRPRPPARAHASGNGKAR
jgi:hypothetical protein